MKSIDEQIETAQRAVESSQARLKRLKHQKADRLLKADNERLRAQNGLYESVLKKVSQIDSQNITFKDGQSFEMINAENLKTVLDELKNDDGKLPF